MRLRGRRGRRSGVRGQSGEEVATGHHFDLPQFRRAYVLVAAAMPTHPHTWHELAVSWTFEPVVVVPLLLSGWLYLRGVRRLWARADRDYGVRRWEVWSYVAGWATLVVALVSPLHSLRRMLF